MGNSKSEISDDSRDYAKTFFEQKLFQQEYFDEQELKYKRILRRTRTNELDLVYFLLSDFFAGSKDLWKELYWAQSYKSFRRLLCCNNLLESGA